METTTSVSAGHTILTGTQPVGSGRPQRELNPGPPLRALPTELPPPPPLPPPGCGSTCEAVVGGLQSDITQRIDLSAGKLTDQLSKFREIFELSITELGKVHARSEKFAGKVYLVSPEYEMFSLHKTNEICRLHGGYMMQVDSREDFKFVVDFLKTHKPYHKDTFRIGANDVEKVAITAYKNNNKKLQRLRFQALYLFKDLFPLGLYYAEDLKPIGVALKMFPLGSKTHLRLCFDLSRKRRHSFES